MVVFTHVEESDINILSKKGFSKEDIKTIYEEHRLRYKDVNIVHYSSGKLLLQGKSSSVEEVAKIIKKLGIGEKVKQEKFRKEEGIIIGSDETLKGDTFGGLVVAAVRADKKTRQELIRLGVADSKTLSDKEILPMADKIRKIVECEVKAILPEEYNKSSGLTELMNRMHKEVADYLKPGKHIVDKYPGCNVGDVAEEKAESKYVEVAAASILARAAGLRQLDFLSMKAGFTIPKGSSHVKLALMEMKEKGLNSKEFVKLHFKNVQEFLR
jgi:ribonuclease HIII